jgi:hypothetical protein
VSSTSGYLGKQTNWDVDAFGEQSQSTKEELWGPMDGEIVDYDAAAGTATVKPLYKPLHNGEPVDMQNLYEVPIELPRTASAGLTMPIPAGTKVRLTPQMRSSENYDTDNNGAPSDARSFHLSDMRASITGGDSLTAPMPNVDPDNTHIRFDPEGNFGIKGSPDGKFKIQGSEGNLYDIIATFMELVASDELQINYGSSAGTGHQLENRAQLMALAAKVRAMAL